MKLLKVTTVFQAINIVFIIEDYRYDSIDDNYSGNKCKYCENRYVCRNLYTFSSDEDQCTYDVEAAKWN